MSHNIQVTTLYETGATPDAIARALSMPEEAVQGILFETSAKFRREISKPAEGQTVADEMLDIIVDVARTSNNPFVKLAAARTARDDLKGRRDAIPTDIDSQNKILVEITARMAEIANKRQEFMRRPELIDV